VLKPLREPPLRPRFMGNDAFNLRRELRSGSCTLHFKIILTGPLRVLLKFLPKNMFQFAVAHGRHYSSIAKNFKFSPGMQCDEHHSVSNAGISSLTLHPLAPTFIILAARFRMRTAASCGRTPRLWTFDIKFLSASVWVRPGR
jgi:hypothetical protein